MQEKVVDGVGEVFWFFFLLVRDLKIIYVKKGIGHRSLLLDLLLHLHIE